MSYLRNWPFSRKLMAVNAGYILPCAVLIFFLMQAKNGQIEFAKKERIGIEYMRPLHSLLTHISQQKLFILRLLDGKKGISEKFDALTAQIERDFINLEEMDLNYGDILQMTPAALTVLKKEKATAQSLKAEWLAIINQRNTLTSAKSEDLFNRLIANVRLAMSHVGDTSNLILDPDLDSYYVMDTLLMALPQSQDRSQELMAYGRLLMLPEESWSEEQKIRINVLAAMLKSDLDRAVASIQTALATDKNHYGSLPSLQREIPLSLKSFTSATEALLGFLSEVATPENFNTRRDEFFEISDKALDSNLAFWEKGSVELDKLLDNRIASFKNERLFDLLLALIAWLPVVLIATLIVKRLNLSFINAVSKLESEANMASSSSVQLASASQTVSAGSTEQAAAIQETGASMTQMASMVSRSSTQALNSQDLARKVKEQTDEGCRVIEMMVRSMESIQDANAQLQNISNIINDISGKTNIINDIVGKTQLLSFNASIEAARAGQHGRGFAVVAEEVGNLAQTSGNAAKEIHNLIEDSRQQVEHILQSTLDRVSEGKSVTEQAQEIFAKIAKDISTISSQIESISEAAREQQFGIEQIAKAMSQMDQSTQTNNSAALSAAQLSDQLMNQSRKLTNIARTVSQLVLGRGPVKLVENNSNFDDDVPLPADSTPKNIAKSTSSMRGHFAAKSYTPEQLAENLANKDLLLDQASGGSSLGVDANDSSFQKLV